MKILIVDDDQVSRLKLGAILKLYGRFKEAAGGEEAYDMIRKGYDSGDPFQLCTLDIDMPGWDGQKTLKEIRAMETDLGIAKKERIPVLMITIKGDQKNIMDAFFSGSEWYLQKPVTPEKLKKSLTKMALLPGEV